MGSSIVHNRSFAPIPQVSADTSRLSPTRNIPQALKSNASYPHTSVCRSLYMELQIASSLVKVVHNEALHTSRSIPVFREHDRVGGQIVLDSSCYHSGRLSVSIEGVFQYTSPHTEAILDPSYTGKHGKDRHVFFSSVTIIQVGPSVESATPRSSSNIREVISTHMRRRRSFSSVDSVKGSSVVPPRTFPFQFDLPLGRTPEQKLPSSFSTSALVGSGLRCRAFMEKAEVNYKVTALWEPNDAYDNRAQLDLPVLLLPDDSESTNDGSAAHPDFWLEMPLISSLSVPFQCAITLPSPVNFSRSATVPYYVVFTTVPKSSRLARDIAINATISVTLVRQVNINTAPSLPPSPPLTPSSSASDSDASSSHQVQPPRPRKFFGRATAGAPPIPPAPRTALTQNINIPRPHSSSPPTTPFSEDRNLICHVSEGFPKRPKSRKGELLQSSLTDPKSALPDGLFKSQLELNKDMLPGIEWPGVSIKYYLDVSVIYRQHETRSRISIRIF